MHTARIPPADPASATITAALVTHTGHICPSDELLLEFPMFEGYSFPYGVDFVLQSTVSLVTETRVSP